MTIIIISATPKYLVIAKGKEYQRVLDHWHIEYKILSSRAEIGDLHGSIKWKGVNINMAELESLIYESLEQEFSN